MKTERFETAEPERFEGVRPEHLKTFIILRLMLEHANELNDCAIELDPNSVPGRASELTNMKLDISALTKDLGIIADELTVRAESLPPPSE